MNVCCCPPVPGCDLGDVCGICWGWAREGPCRDSLPWQGFSCGFLLWKRVCFIQSHMQALLPNLPWHMQPVGTPQGKQNSSHSQLSPSEESGMGLSILSLWVLSFPGGLTEKLWFLHLIPSFLPQVLGGPGGPAVCPSLHQCQQLGLSKGWSQIQSNGKQQAWGRRKSSSCSFELRANCPASGQWGDPAKELALPQLCERRWCWGQHSDQLHHPHLAKSWSRPEQLLSLLPDTPGDVSDSSCSSRLLPAGPTFPAPNQKACLKI